MLDFILLLAAVVCLGLAAFGIDLTTRIRIGWLGLFFFVLVAFINAAQGVF